MFSKSLFKQSCKANGIMWIIITFAVCFMLSCVMLISGNGTLSETKTAIQDTIIKSELEAQTKLRAINYYETANDALMHFDGTLAQEFANGLQDPTYWQLLATSGEEVANRYLAANAYAVAVADLQQYTADLIQKLGYEEGSNDALELTGIIFYTLNPMNKDDQGNIYYTFDKFYTDLGEDAPRYDLDLTKYDEPTRTSYRKEYVTKNSVIFLANNMVLEENVQRILDVLQNFGVTKEQYDEFGFNDYLNVKRIGSESLINYKANLEYRLNNLEEGETEQAVKDELKGKVSSSILQSLPQDVASALAEIGSMDLYGIIVGSIFFKMAGLLLPIIYMIMTANALIAGQVDSGSMAYVLSTSTKRKQVTFTQALYLVGSIFAMFVCTALTSVVCFAIVDVPTDLTYGKLLLINFGAFVVMFAMSGICFLASCFFNRSKHSMAIGGGLNMFFLVATMLGLFGSPVLPSIVRMSALNAFNYVSIISLFDVVSILEGTTTFLWKLAILIAVGVACFVAGSIKFQKKDLPL